IGQVEAAARVHNAWLKTMEDGIHTYDIFKEGVSKEKVGTKEFAQAVIKRLGQKPSTLKAVSYRVGDKGKIGNTALKKRPPMKKETIGIDVFLDWKKGTADELGSLLQKANGDGVKLAAISNRGIKVWPDGFPETFCSDHWRLRYFAEKDKGTISHAQIVSLLTRLNGLGVDFIKTENLCTFDGTSGFSLGQGE
ncbi:MAG: NADP-dependent isocitrate dehydrogenase, partial [Spirochaetia bacterium]|nr:NADP-dependent isocitrate dehydrogenase [Spirochaetia bacterium]